MFLKPSSGRSLIGVGGPLDGTPEELAELAGRLFGMARAGDARRLAAYWTPVYR